MSRLDYSSDGMFDFKSYYDKVSEQLPSPCRICEIGVADGFSALYLAEKLNSLDKQFKLYMVDSMDYGGYLQQKSIYENIIKTGLGHLIEVIPFDSLKAVEKFNGHYFDFVFIDSSHTYEDTLLEIPAWYNKVKDDGVLAGHDVFGYSTVGKAVNELIPKIIVNTKDEHETGLVTYETEKGCGVWEIKKRYWWNP